MAIHKLKIFAGSGSHELAAKIAESYGCELGDLLHLCENEAGEWHTL